MFTHSEDPHLIQVRDRVRGFELAGSNIGEDPPELAVLGHVEGLLDGVHNVFGLGVYGNQVLQHDTPGGEGRGGEGRGGEGSEQNSRAN